MFIPKLVGVIVLMAVTASGDDTQALRDTVSSLCDLNQQGSFHTCCVGNDVGSILIQDKTTWECFISGLSSTTENTVTSLNFGSKELTVLGSGVFSNLTNLQSLVFESNSLGSIESGAFQGLNNLISLSFYRCGLASIHPDAFKDLVFLRTLGLQYNSLESLDSTSFKNLKSLTTLFLNFNQLTSLPSGIFSNQISLQDLALSYNSLTSLPKGIFDQLTSIDSLFLQSNSLAYIDLGKVTPSTLNLQSNYLVSYHHDEEVVENDILQMNIFLEKNCLVSSQIPPYKSDSVNVYIGGNQGNCPIGTCTKKELREIGCFLCSNGGDDSECMTCIEGFILYHGNCIECFPTEECPFNNSDEVECVDENNLFHCEPERNLLNCSNHTCVYGICGNGVVEGIEECDSTEHCGNNCKCEEGYFISTSTPGICVPPSSTSDSSSSGKGKVSSGFNNHLEQAILIIAVVVALFV